MAQDPDWLHFRGRRRMLLSYPLDAYLRDLSEQPALRMWSTANRRGYVATWEVRDDDTLWLTGLQTRLDDQADPGLRAVFPDAAGPVEARWVSQSLRVPDGEQLRYVHMGYGSQYARETLLLVWAGQLLSIDEIDGKTGQQIGGWLTRHLEGVFGPEEGAFLRAIHSAPGDLAPRLIYADWLDERHDPRADVIRLAERLRPAGSAAAMREWGANRESVRRGLSHRLWVLLMYYGKLLDDSPAGLTG
jgi:uncharacterized protein (TIGR02996 family)